LSTTAGINTGSPNHEQPKDVMKRIIRYISGITLLVLGVIGLFLPVLQGILMIIVGLLILAPESKLIQKMLGKLREKYPELYEKAMGKKKKTK